MQDGWYNLGRELEYTSLEDPWGLSPLRIAPAASGDSSLALQAGASVNCAHWRLIPHVHATHTETSRHIDANGPSITELRWPVAVEAALLRIAPVQLSQTGETGPRNAQASDLVITRASLRAAADVQTKALILATRARDVRASPSPYLTLEAMRWVVALGVEHLLVDMPSVDRADDGGELLCHREFWQTDAPGIRMQRATITEQIGVPHALPAGTYFLLLQPMLAETDAAPSSPLIRKAQPPVEAVI